MLAVPVAALLDIAQTGRFDASTRVVVPTVAGVWPAPMIVKALETDEPSAAATALPALHTRGSAACMVKGDMSPSDP
jgi:hypothetical protein